MMGCTRDPARLLLVLFMLSMVSTLLCVETVPDINEGFNETKKYRHEKKKKVPEKTRGYKTSEKIEKAPSENHPCKLIRTSERISFPALRDELFVNILGYREPNLVHVMRCKGLCGDAETPIACIAVKIHERKVMMMFKTNSSGRDSKHRMKELILDEHVECGCKCLNTAHCVGLFNDVTCDCECDHRRFGEEKRACDSGTGTYWDSSMCRCKSKSVAPRGLDYQNIECNRGVPGPGAGQGYIEYSIMRGFDMFQFVMLGSGITVSIFLSAASCYYKRKFEQLKMKKERNNSEKKHQKTKKTREKHPSREKHKHKKVKVGATNNVTKNTSKQAVDDLEQMLESVLLSPTFGDMYHEQYDEHGVRVERQVSDTELISKYVQNA